MPKKKAPPRFNVGDSVRAKPGVTDPDFPDMPFGGWAGTIAEVEEEGDWPTYLLLLNERTLKSIHPVYFNRCERDGLEPDQVWLLEEDLEADVGAPVEIEQPTQIVVKPLDMNDQDDRIRSVFGLTSDDPLPESDEESLRAYYKFLAAKLSFPFEAKSPIERLSFGSKTYAITVLGLLDPEEVPGQEYGLLCQARRGAEQIEVPLTEVAIGSGNANRRIIEDYSHWVVNW
jgi:hypothetical protein